MGYPNTRVFLYFSAFTGIVSDTHDSLINNIPATREIIPEKDGLSYQKKINLISINTGAVFSWTSPTIPKLYSNNTDINPLGQPITTSEESLLASLQTAGAIIGTITGGMMAESLGRKITLVINSLCFVVSYVIFILSTNIKYYYVGRSLTGLGAGAILSVLPSYIGEISENSNRGRTGSLQGIMGGIGHLMCFGIGPLVTISTFSYIQLIPAVIFLFVFTIFIPESPYYFLAKNDDANALRSLKKLRKGSNDYKELLYLKEVVNEKKNTKMNWSELALPATRNGLIVSCGILILQTFTGISIILFYLQPILDASGNVIPSNLASLIIGLVQIFSSIFSGFLIDRVGRKILLNISSTGCSVSLASLGLYFFLKERNCNLDSIYWLPLASLIIFYFLFNIGYGPIPWAIGGELFASNVKSVCVSIYGFIGLLVNLAVAASFPFVREIFGLSNVFFVFSGLAASASLFVCLVVPETKGKSFEEIQNDLSGGKQNK